MIRTFDRFNAHDLSVLDETAAPGYVDHEQSGQSGTGVAGTRRRLELFIRAFPDATFEPLDIIADDSCGVIRFRMTGTQRGEFMGIEPTGRTIDLEGVDIVRFNAEGKVAEHWGYTDNLQMLRQLGAVSERMPVGAT